MEDTKKNRGQQQDPTEYKNKSKKQQNQTLLNSYNPNQSSLFQKTLQNMKKEMEKDINLDKQVYNLRNKHKKNKQNQNQYNKSQSQHYIKNTQSTATEPDQEYKYQNDSQKYIKSEQNTQQNYPYPKKMSIDSHYKHNQNKNNNMQQINSRNTSLQNFEGQITSQRIKSLQNIEEKIQNFNRSQQEKEKLHNFIQKTDFSSTQTQDYFNSIQKQKSNNNIMQLSVTTQYSKGFPNQIHHPKNKFLSPQAAQQTIVNFQQNQQEKQFQSEKNIEMEKSPIIYNPNMDSKKQNNSANKKKSYKLSFLHDVQSQIVRKQSINLVSPQKSPKKQQHQSFQNTRNISNNGEALSAKKQKNDGIKLNNVLDNKTYSYQKSIQPLSANSQNQNQNTENNLDTENQEQVESQQQLYTDNLLFNTNSSINYNNYIQQSRMSSIGNILERYPSQILQETIQYFKENNNFNRQMNNQQQGLHNRMKQVQEEINNLLKKNKFQQEIEEKEEIKQEWLQQLLFSLKKAHPNFFQNVPSGRSEIVSLKKWITDTLQNLLYQKQSTDENEREIILKADDVLVVAFNEILRQITYQCVERGELLLQIFSSYFGLFHQIQNYEDNQKLKLKEQNQINNINNQEKLKDYQISMNKKIQVVQKQLNEAQNKIASLEIDLLDEEQKNKQLQQNLIKQTDINKILKKTTVDLYQQNKNLKQRTQQRIQNLRNNFNQGKRRQSQLVQGFGSPLGQQSSLQQFVQMQQNGQVNIQEIIKEKQGEDTSSSNFDEDSETASDVSLTDILKEQEKKFKESQKQQHNYVVQKQEKEVIFKIDQCEQTDPFIAQTFVKSVKIQTDLQKLQTNVYDKILDPNNINSIRIQQDVQDQLLDKFKKVDQEVQQTQTVDQLTITPRSIQNTKKQQQSIGFSEFSNTLNEKNQQISIKTILKGLPALKQNTKEQNLETFQQFFKNMGILKQLVKKEKEDMEDEKFEELIEKNRKKRQTVRKINLKAFNVSALQSQQNNSGNSSNFSSMNNSCNKKDMLNVKNPDQEGDNQSRSLTKIGSFNHDDKLENIKESEQEEDGGSPNHINNNKKNKNNQSSNDDDDDDDDDDVDDNKNNKSKEDQNDDNNQNSIQKQNDSIQNNYTNDICNQSNDKDTEKSQSQSQNQNSQQEQNQKKSSFQSQTSSNSQKIQRRQSLNNFKQNTDQKKSGLKIQLIDTQEQQQKPQTIANFQQTSPVKQPNRKGRKHSIQIQLNKYSSFTKLNESNQNQNTDFSSLQVSPQKMYKKKGKKSLNIDATSIQSFQTGKQQYTSSSDSDSDEDEEEDENAVYLHKYQPEYIDDQFKSQVLAIMHLYNLELEKTKNLRSGVDELVKVIKELHHFCKTMFSHIKKTQSNTHASIIESFYQSFSNVKWRLPKEIEDNNSDDEEEKEKQEQLNQKKKLKFKNKVAIVMNFINSTEKHKNKMTTVNKKQSPGVVIINKIKKGEIKVKNNNLFPIKTILKNITQLYDTRVRMVRENRLEKDCEMPIYCFSKFMNIYGFRAVAESKFTQFLISIKYHLSLYRINFFGKLIGITSNNMQENYTPDEVAKYFEAYEFIQNVSKYGHDISNVESDVKQIVPYLKVIDYVKVKLEPVMKPEYLMEIKNYIEENKESDKNFDYNGQYYLEFDHLMTVVLQKYRLVLQQAQLFVIHAFQAADLDWNQNISLSEFIVLYRHIENERFKFGEVLRLFDDSADLITDDKKEMSFEKFTSTCVEYNLFSLQSQDKFLGIEDSETEEQKQNFVSHKIQLLKDEWEHEKKSIEEALNHLKEYVTEDTYENWVLILSILENRLKNADIQQGKPTLMTYKLLKNELDRLIQEGEKNADLEEQGKFDVDDINPEEILNE